MTVATPAARSWDAEVAAFQRDGFVVIPNALSPAQVAGLNAAFTRYETEFGPEWSHFSESFIHTADVLPHLSDFDATIENPVVLPFLQRLLGEKLAFEELSLMIRNPTDNVGELKGWHRDVVRAFDRRHEIKVLSVVYYLTDVTANDHCFSIIPGTHDGPRGDMRPEDVRPGMEIDAIGPAGSAYIFHARAIHAGKLKLGSRTRRTIHLYYGQYGDPRSSEWTTIPPRLADKHDPSLPPWLYAKARVTDIIDGTGRKPRDVPPDMTTAQMLIHVQRRANQKAPAP
ncbi:MAG: phytanoyl-CoA dioxygenase family protein [Rhodoferax sp.]|jgi:ectoine hydroxylase-related dioxygenase (phytanoyl-CoA dioxygenase family)|nr:phytanoyl-CoA dioxygenase family protein [Rhodoferax sp.]